MGTQLIITHLTTLRLNYKHDLSISNKNYQCLPEGMEEILDLVLIAYLRPCGKDKLRWWTVTTSVGDHAKKDMNQ